MCLVRSQFQFPVEKYVLYFPFDGVGLSYIKRGQRKVGKEIKHVRRESQ